MSRRVKLTHKRQPSFIRPESTSSIETKKPKKSVRFRENDTLEEVRLFIQTEMPIACQSDPTCLLKYYLSCPNWGKEKQQGPIMLEEIDLVDNCLIIGTCQVANFAYEKQVKVRYTLDDWISFKENNAFYKEPIAEHWDRFTFKIECNHTRHLHLAVQYKVAGQEFWDNNFKMNYQLDINAQVIDDESSSDEELNDVYWAPTPNYFYQKKDSYESLPEHISLS